MTTLLVGAGGTRGVLARYGISRLAGRAVDYLTPIQLLVLLDEPWSNIDRQLRSLLRDEIAAILREVGGTAVLVTHDREEAFCARETSSRKARPRSSTSYRATAGRRSSSAPPTSCAATSSAT